MENLLGFMSMAGNYEQRKVANTICNGAEIDTCRVTDSYQDYETGIRHKAYNGGKWIIVQMYDTKEEAIQGHNKWVAKFKNKLPSKLKDVSTSEIKQLLRMVDTSDFTYVKKQ